MLILFKKKRNNTFKAFVLKVYPNLAKIARNFNFSQASFRLELQSNFSTRDKHDKLNSLSPIDISSNHPAGLNFRRFKLEVRGGRVERPRFKRRAVHPACELEFNWGLTPPAQDFYNYISHSTTLRGATRRERGANDTTRPGEGEATGSWLAENSLSPVVGRTQVMEETKNSPPRIS